MRAVTTVRGIICATILCLLTGQAHAFDGKRKGFVLGGGLGPAPVAHWKGPVIDQGAPGTISQKVTVDETRFGLGVNILIGYAWDEQNLLALEGNVAAFKSDILLGRPDVGQGFGGVSWYHYYGPGGSSVFTVVGLGGYTFQIEDDDAADSDVGFLLGAGYEFSPHWQVGGYFSFGSTTDSIGENDHANFSVLVNAIAF